MAIHQASHVSKLIDRISGVYELVIHHGDCIGSDEEFHDIIQNLNARRDPVIHTIIHPPLNISKRAFCRGEHVTIREPKQYRYRNEDIIDESNAMIFTPLQNHEVIRSGTWMTFRTARDKFKCPYSVYYPDGSIMQGNKWRFG